MENQEEKQTSLDYFFKVTKNNAINLGRLIEMYVHAKKIYNMEIEEAKKESFEEAKKIYAEEIQKAFEKGHEEGAKYMDGLVRGERFPF